jgi:ferredoxin
VLGRPFELHYSVRRRADAGFLEDIAATPWRDAVKLHVSDEGARADIATLIPAYEPGFHLYTCGSARYMDALFAAAEARGWPEEALHKEYFSVPEAPEHESHPFRLKLAKSGRVIDVPADRRATEVLAEAGIAVDTKCSDGICGVCAATVVAGEVEHRDHVLSRKQRENRMILCCSRAVAPGGEIAIDL